MSSANGPVPTKEAGTPRNPFYLVGGAVLLVVIILSILIFARLKAQNKAETPAAEAGLQFTIQRLAPAVFLGKSDPLAEVTADDAQPFPLNFQANTSRDGEAVIKGNVEGASCSIFIFFDTRLQRSACNQAASDGNTTCLEEGSAVFENCHNHLVQTASGEVKLLGTWASVTYLPGQKLTLLAVTEGETSVQPVLDDANQTMGIPVEVGAGQYLYTAPDRVMQAVPGVPPRQAVPLNKIEQILAQYPQAADWITLAMDRSRAYGVDPDKFAPLTETPTPIEAQVPESRLTSIGSSTPAITPPQIGQPPDLFVIPRYERANPPAIDGYCQEAVYGQGYFYRFALRGNDTANGYLMQDDDWLYICGTYSGGFPMEGRLSIYLDPQGDGGLYPFANQGDYQLRLDLSTGETDILIGNGSDGYIIAADDHQNDWLSAMPRLENPQVLFEFAIRLQGFAIGNCGNTFGLAMI